MDFLERAAKNSIQKLEQLDKEIASQQQQQQQNHSEQDVHDYPTKRTPPEELLFSRTNELIEIREVQKRDLERILSKANASGEDSTNRYVTNDSVMRQTERIDRLNAQISQERALRASIEASTAGNLDDETSTTGDSEIVQELVRAQKELSVETRMRDDRLEALLAVKLKQDDAKVKLERLEEQLIYERGTLAGTENSNNVMPNAALELEDLRTRVEERRQTLNEQTRTNTNTAGSSIQEVELEASLNAKADELIQAQIAIERHTSEIATLAMRRNAMASFSKTSSERYDSSMDPATSTRDLLHFEEQRNVFEHFRTHIARFIGHRRAGKVVYMFSELDRAMLFFARTASSNGKWRAIGCFYFVLVVSYALLRMMF
jgi:hypothetical protein